MAEFGDNKECSRFRINLPSSLSIQRLSRGLSADRYEYKGDLEFYNKYIDYFKRIADKKDLFEIEIVGNKILVGVFVDEFRSDICYSKIESLIYEWKDNNHGHPLQ